MDEAAQREQPYAERPPGASGSGLRDLVERALYVGIGAVALTGERLQPIVDDFVASGRLSAEDGRALVDRVAERSREEIRALVGRVDRPLRSGHAEALPRLKRDVEDLDFRLRSIEHRLELLERQFDGWREPAE